MGIASKKETVQPTRLLGWGIRFFLGAALTASQTPGGYAPFALGWVAAAGAGAEGLAALLGTALGAALFLSFAEALPFLATGVLLLTVSTALRETRLMDRPWVLPAAAAGMTAAVGGIYVMESLAPLDHLAPCIAAAALAGAAAWFMGPLLRPSSAGELPGAILFLLSALLLALAPVELLGISIGRTLLGVVLTYAAYDQGPMVGAAAGLGLGLTADLCGDTGGGLFTAVYGLAGFVVGRGQGKSGRGRAALSFLGASMLALLPARQPQAFGALGEALASSVLFLLLPSRVFGGKRVRREEMPVNAIPSGEKLKARLTKAASALRELYDSMSRPARGLGEENPAIIFDRAAEKVCRGCALVELCWQKEYTSTFNALNDATPFLLERGRALPKDFPPYFADRCIHLPDFIIAVNGELSAFLLRRQYRRELEETRRNAQGQYAQLSELLTATAAGLEESAYACVDAPLCRVGAVLRPKAGDTVCGDTVASFQRENGQWCLLLSDGMGSGEAARKESALTCRLVQQFLEAGIEPDAALKTLNAAMALRGAETGSFTTVDLFLCDPKDGSAVFYKYGAAPSYLKKGGVVRRITGVSLPVGLRGEAGVPDVTRATLAPGSFAVMISDGVADPNDDEWVQDLLAGWPGEDPQQLASAILAESVKREKLQDDCGIQVFYRPKEGSLQEV